jgi:7,8-dihydroneopterin aldolase/epimerase/oxygenase
MTDTQRIADASLGLRHVFLRDMVLQASIGVHPPEHEAPQRVRINVDLAVGDDGARPLSRAPISRSGVGRSGVGRDDLPRVVDYEKIADAVRRIVASGHVRLAETLAERIAEACLADRRVRVARVRVEKLDVFPDAASAGVEIERRQGN